MLDDSSQFPVSPVSGDLIPALRFHRHTCAAQKLTQAHTQIDVRVSRRVGGQRELAHCLGGTRGCTGLCSEIKNCQFLIHCNTSEDKVY